MRSKLFVPGSRPELFDKALASEADALSFDLEDAVAEPRKAEARQTLGRFLRGAGAAASGKTLIVRINALDTPHAEADLQAIAQPGVHLVNLPKPEHPDDVRRAAALLQAAEQAAADGVGAWVVDGRMVDAPFLARARATVQWARRLGLLPATP